MSKAAFWDWTLVNSDGFDRIVLNKDHVMSVIFGIYEPERTGPAIRITMSNGDMTFLDDSKQNRDAADKYLKELTR